MKFRAFFILLLLATSGLAQLRTPKAVPSKHPPPKPAPAKPTPAKPAGKPVEETDETALGALKLLPKDMVKRVARIEAREGRPWPERWYVLVFDPAAPHGLREFVFSEGKLVTSRTLSQFADGLTKDDVIGVESIRVNNDTAAGMAAQFAIYNRKRLGGVEYELRKVSGVPVWRLTCTDARGQAMGVVEVHAGKGTLVNFEGFENSPVAIVPLPAAKAALAKAKGGKTAKGDAPIPPAKKPADKPPIEKKPEKQVAEKPVQQKPVVEKPIAEKAAVEKPTAETPNDEKPVVDEKPAARTEKIADERRAPKEKPVVAEKPARETPAKKAPPVVAAEPPRAVPVARTVPEPTPAPGTVKRIGNSVKRLFGRDE